MDIFKILMGIGFLNMVFEIYIRFFPYSKRENIMVYQIWLNIEKINKKNMKYMSSNLGM